MNKKDLYLKSPEAEQLLKTVPFRLRLITLLSFLLIAAVLVLFLLFIKFPTLSKKEYYVQLNKINNNEILLFQKSTFQNQELSKIIEIEIKGIDNKNAIVHKSNFYITNDTIYLKHNYLNNFELKQPQTIFISITIQQGEKNILQKIFF